MLPAQVLAYPPSPTRCLPPLPHYSLRLAVEHSRRLLWLQFCSACSSCSRAYAWGGNACDGLAKELGAQGDQSDAEGRGLQEDHEGPLASSPPPSCSSSQGSRAGGDGLQRHDDDGFYACHGKEFFQQVCLCTAGRRRLPARGGGGGGDELDGHREAGEVDACDVEEETVPALLHRFPAVRGSSSSSFKRGGSSSSSQSDTVKQSDAKKKV
mmetsp:Transcript_18766/g.43119  ORF Transcript_18766/g.43119 Transcript_18766/m.43119 type:complete len:211 (+) Transcript_18766:2024-2656(+)